MILVVGLSHKSAPIEVRERLAVPADDLPEFLASLAALPEVAEVLVLSTCNRVEVFATTKLGEDLDGSRAGAAIEQRLCQRARDSEGALVRSHLFHYVQDPAVRHLFRVAASLDSLVVGEPQILGQLKDAYELASHAGTIGALLGRAVETALHVAKRVRSETQIGLGTVSISSVAIDLARQIFGELRGRLVALLGAGEMAEAAAKVLCEEGARLFVVNRSLEHAQQVAALFQGEARPWTELRQVVIEADVLIASTASQHYVLTRELVGSTLRSRRGRSLFLIDIAVPRNIEPSVQDLEGVYLYDIDDLERIASERLRDRLAEAQRAEAIVDEEADAFGTWLEGLRVAPAIVALRKQVQGVLVAELDRSLGTKLKHLGEQERSALQALVCAATNKLTHAPSTRLKAAAAEGAAGPYVEALWHLFDLPVDSLEGLQEQRDSNRSSQPPNSRPSKADSGEKTPREKLESDGEGVEQVAPDSGQQQALPRISREELSGNGPQEAAASRKEVL